MTTPRPQHPIDECVQALSHALSTRSWRLACAESCTGGRVAAACTARAGSSAWFDRGFVTYSNDAKSQMLGVDAALIEQQGAVSEAVVRAMVLGALTRSNADVAVAVSGVAGPGGGSALKPVGLVWFAWGRKARCPDAATAGGAPRDVPGDAPVSDPQITSRQCRFDGDREAVQQAATWYAIDALTAWIEHGGGVAGPDDVVPS